jgi:FolB domain-containing protein
MAYLRINHLITPTIVGCLDWEQEKTQDIIIDAQIEFDAMPASLSDELTDTINYAELADDISRHLRESRFRLIEKVAVSVLDIILQNPRVESARVRIRKPHAITNAESAEIEIYQQRRR